MDYENITTDPQLRDFCRAVQGSDSIAFDTEFVSEHTHRPQLCLVQVAAGDRLAVIDAMTIDDLRPFWDIVVADGHETLFHSGRSEMEFCFQATGQLPARPFDVQIAAGLAGIEYPAGYGTLIAKLLGEAPNKHETRTDWRKRPLSARQIEYALEDACYLHPIRSELHARLSELGRLGWIEEEMASWLEQIRHSLSHERWRRVSGNSGLDSRSLAIVRELWKWRDAEAQRRDQPAKRVLRDDLIVEMAKRQTSDAKRILALRGMERGDLKRQIGAIAEAIERALSLPEEQCPEKPPREPSQQLSVLGQFLFAALGSICREVSLAPNLVGGPNDIRDLILYRRSGSAPDRRVPRLAQGWRAEFVGRLFDDLLDGKVAVRVGDLASEHPLVFDRE